MNYDDKADEIMISNGYTSSNMHKEIADALRESAALRYQEGLNVGELAGWNKAIAAQCEFCAQESEPEWSTWNEVSRWWHKTENALCQADDIRRAREEWLLEAAAIRADKRSKP